MRIPAIFAILWLLAMDSSVFAGEPSILETGELVVVYDNGLEQAAQNVLAEYPAIRQDLEKMFQWSVEFRPTLVLLNEQNRFQRLAGHDLVVAYALPEKNLVVVDHSKMNTSPFTLQTTFKHELCHLLLHHYIRNDHLPRWLDEGICQWASDGLADIIMGNSRDLLPAAVLSDTYFDLAKLEHQFPQENNALMLAYEQSKSVVAYLIRRYGSQGMRDFLGMLRQGADLQVAFERRYAIPLDEFESQWRNHLEEDINWFTYLSVHLYEILFVSAALLTISGFIRRLLRKRTYEKQDEEMEEL
jgi:hypothetical protein